MTALPMTPDFDIWPVRHTVQNVSYSGDAFAITWSDGSQSHHHALLLRENSPDPVTTHPKAREMAIGPEDIPEDLQIIDARLQASGAVWVEFSDGLQSEYHPGWLRGTAWFGEEKPAQLILWTAGDQPEPPTFDGPAALEDADIFLAWLETLHAYGVARLRGLPQQDGLLEQIVTRIGPVRESNFGRQYVLEIKDDPDSQAYTSGSLLQHIDLPTRELPFGLQFLYTRENTTTGGEGLYVDAYRVAEDMRQAEPDHFHSLVTDIWEYNNRSKTSDYRGRGPVIETDAAGAITGVRYNTFLRAPMKAPLEVQARAYKAYRAFSIRAQSVEYQMKFRYEPGDLLAFDNRRALHGRAGYDAQGGARFIEGIYSDRDDLHSRIRTLKRQQRTARATRKETPMSVTQIKTPQNCSEAEWQTRVELAALFRIIAHYGMSDLANGAVCARVPDEPDHYLVHPYGMFWEEARASSMIKIDAAGQPVDPDAPWLNDGVQNLCQWILGSRPDANFFVHGHEEEVMAVGSIKEGFLPLSQPAVYLGNITGYIEYEFEEDEAFGAHFVEQLGDNQILISRNHGYYALGETAAAAFFRAYFLRQTCSTQIKTLSMGRDLHLIDPQKVARYQDQMAASEHYNYNGKTEWPGLIRILDARGRDYAS